MEKRYLELLTKKELKKLKGKEYIDSHICVNLRKHYKIHEDGSQKDVFLLTTDKVLSNVDCIIESLTTQNKHIDKSLLKEAPSSEYIINTVRSYLILICGPYISEYQDPIIFNFKSSLQSYEKDLSFNKRFNSKSLLNCDNIKSFAQLFLMIDMIYSGTSLDIITRDNIDALSAEFLTEIEKYIYDTIGIVDGLNYVIDAFKFYGLRPIAATYMFAYYSAITQNFKIYSEEDGTNIVYEDNEWIVVPEPKDNVTMNDLRKQVTSVIHPDYIVMKTVGVWTKGISESSIVPIPTSHSILFTIEAVEKLLMKGWSASHINKLYMFSNIRVLETVSGVLIVYTDGTPQMEKTIPEMYGIPGMERLDSELFIDVINEIDNGRDEYEIASMYNLSFGVVLDIKERRKDFYFIKPKYEGTKSEGDSGITTEEEQESRVSEDEIHVSTIDEENVTKNNKKSSTNIEEQFDIQTEIDYRTKLSKIKIEEPRLFKAADMIANNHLYSDVRKIYTEFHPNTLRAAIKHLYRTRNGKIVGRTPYEDLPIKYREIILTEAMHIFVEGSSLDIVSKEFNIQKERLIKIIFDLINFLENDADKSVAISKEARRVNIGS